MSAAFAIRDEMNDIEEAPGKVWFWELERAVIDTGRKHQIRVHLAGIGCPVIGDGMYGAKLNPAERLGLHAWKLTFDHPTSGKRVEVESPFPKGLRKLVVQ